MQQVLEDIKWKTTERATCRGFAKKPMEWRFISELLLLIDMLQVLGSVSITYRRQTQALNRADYAVWDEENS